MAIYHLTAQVGSRSGGQSAAAKFAYLCHQGRYSRDTSELVHAESGGLPGWAGSDPGAYWKAADQYERANGRLYQQVEVGLPVELSREQQVELAQCLARELASTPEGPLPYTLVVHRGQGRNPHAHVLLSERVADAHDRTPESWFRRAAAVGRNCPELGGARKTAAFQPREWVSGVRARWAELANTALEGAGQEARIDHRSHAARGLEERPTVHQGPPGLQQRERGLPGDRAALNAEIRAANLQLGEIRTQSKSAQMQVEALQRKLGQQPGPAAVGSPEVARFVAPEAAVHIAPEANPEVLRFIEVHRGDFATQAEAVRWFDRENIRLRTLKNPATARGLFEESVAAPERERPDFGNVLEQVLVTPRWQDAPLSVAASIVQAAREVLEWRATAAEIEQCIAAHRDQRSLWRRLLGADPELLRLQRERDSALAQVALQRATLARIERRWEEEQPAWEREAAEKNAAKRTRQSEAAERLSALRPEVLQELERREAEPLRPKPGHAEQAEYIRARLNKGMPAEELWLDMLLRKEYSIEEQNQLDALIRGIQAERKAGAKQDAGRPQKSRRVQFGVEWIGFD